MQLNRVTCLCAQFEAVLQHGLRRSRGLALTAAAIKQAAGFSSKTETEPVFWYYVKEVLNRHELQRFYSLRAISTDIGRGRAWLRCALNEHSLERYVHMLLADKNRLSVFYEDWSFMMDEERSSMIPTMAAGLNSILFAINIDNKDLNGQSKCTPTVSDLLKESTQNVTSLLKESTQGVSSLLREITASSAVSILIKADPDTDPLPVVPRSGNADLRYKKDRKKKKRVTNIISFDEEEDEQNLGDSTKTLITGESSEESVDRSSVLVLSSSESTLGKNVNGDESNSSWKSNSFPHSLMNGEYEYQKLDVKSIDDEDADEDELYGKTLGNKGTEGETEASEKPHEIGSCSSQICSWTPLQVLNDDSDVLFPVSAVGSYSQTDNLENGEGHEHVRAVELVPRRADLPYRVEVSPPAQVNTLSSMLPSATVPESMTINELRQAIMAMMNRKDELEEQNRSLRNLLDAEMELSAALRQEVDNWRRKVAEQEERHATKVQALARENEVLKVQLKKYVGAVQMLRREGQTVEVLPNLWSTDGEFTIPEQKQVENNEELASSYERKLIEVAEMHGELIEFNERLHRALMAKEALVAQMRQELIDLRGPVPGDLSQTSEDQSLSDFEISNRALINVWIPSVFLRGKAANAFHVYQVYIRIKDDEWNVYRRYAEFRSLHHKLQSKYQQVRTFNFPPKKAIGNKDAKFVEERRKQLQNYLRNVMNKIIQTVPEFTANPKKETLIQLMPFFVKDIQKKMHFSSISHCQLLQYCLSLMDLELHQQEILNMLDSEVWITLISGNFVPYPQFFC
ncbi:sorting nexin-29 isoform X2 [Empidonax traillii]|uniref:sorting nexin-29 isoform X2 n=1 Tax=Empidonax traillii TaxID=164674 RepID=UPI000FFD7C69|nr:sorting nexin-29 isoform X2 [Empidonax traillii]